MRTIALRLRPGADLKAELLALAVREHLRAGWVLTCVGSLSRVRLRLAGGAEHRTWQGPFEIVALTGTLSQDGGHLHLAVADHQGRTLGGHLAEGCTVRTTAEVILAADDRLVFAREHDPATGYDELVVRKPDPPEARDRHRSSERGPIRPWRQQACSGTPRETAAGLTDSGLKTHPELRPAGATRCHSLLLAGRAILDLDLREWLFLLVTARGNKAPVCRCKRHALPLRHTPMFTGS